MPAGDLDAGLARLRDAAAAATSHRDPAATERAGRRRRARQATAALAAALAAAAVAAAVVALPIGRPARPARAPLAAPPPTTVPYDALAEAASATIAHEDGLTVALPDGWALTRSATCPGRAGRPEAVAPGRGVAPVGPGCAPAAAPFALIELRPAAVLDGASVREVAGRRALVRAGPAGTGPLPAPAGWTVTTAVLPAEGGALWLQVAEPGPGRPLFERILGGVGA